MIPVFCKEYFDLMDQYPDEFPDEQWNLRTLVTNAYETEDLVVDIKLYERYISLGKYLGFKDGYPWERYWIGCNLCTFTQEDVPRWHDSLNYMGRGAGKDGFISWISLCLISPYSPIKNYDVDICAFNEDQALRPVQDLSHAMDDNPEKMSKHFYWTKEKILGKKNRGTVLGHTNNAKGKDGLRSGIVILNEIHTYENYDNIDVFTTGLGKKKHPRLAYFTTNGYVSEGPLDDLLEEAESVLSGDKPDDGTFYFIFKLNSKDLVHDERMWNQANPSLRYKPELMTEYRKEYKKWKDKPAQLPGFMTKRMNIRQQKEASPVASWENIAATNNPLPDLFGWECTCGIDFSKTNDWMAVNLHFKKGNIRYDINHAWICLKSKELWRLKCPFRDWATAGYVTLVDQQEINPELIIEYLEDALTKYTIVKVAVDNFRYALLKDYLLRLFDEKDIKLTRNSDIMKVAPIVIRCFLQNFFVWGEQPCLRWATNNTKLVPAKKSAMSKDGELDIGNYLFGKIEPKSRKTDPFFALVHSMTLEDELHEPIVWGGAIEQSVFTY